MRSSLQRFVTDLRQARDRGLPITVEDVCDGLERAIADKESRSGNQPLDFALASDFAMGRARTFLRGLGQDERDWLAFKRSEVEEAREEDRRFGQPHYRHPDDDATVVFPQK